MKEYEVQKSNGTWGEVSDIDYFIPMILKTEEYLAPRQNRKPMLSKEDVVNALDSGRVVIWGQDWYDKIRAKPEPIEMIHVEMSKCACGHRIPRASVMSTSRGTSCPDCYDMMSD